MVGACFSAKVVYRVCKEVAAHSHSQSRGESGPTTQEEYHVTHYTSHDLLSWEFRGFLPSGGKG